jgi:hypothetical protein
MITERERAQRIIALVRRPSNMVDSLYGDAARYVRREIMRLLGQQLPISKCGVTVVRLALLDHYRVSPDECIAVQDDLLQCAIEEAARG